MAETENKISQKDKKRLVKALFSYTPVNIDELQLKVNDILEVTEETEEGWWKGILNGAVGMFPSNFVVELDSNVEDLNNFSTNELSPTKSSSKIKNVDAQDSGTKHDSSHFVSNRTTYSSSNNEDVVESSKTESSKSESSKSESSKSESSGEKKISVSKKNVADSSAPRLPPKPVREQARVIYPYNALNEDELSLKEGDIITVISKEVEDKGWWKGELNNKTGVFPDNFVQLIKVEEQKKPERPDKPSTALSSRSSLKSCSSDKSASEFSPKSDKKVLKTPPVKPPPPEVHKKEVEKPVPPYPSKKPQVPYPMKKPSRSSLSSKFSSFSPPTPTKRPAPPDVASVPPPPLIPAADTKPDVSRVPVDMPSKEDKKEKDDKKEKESKKEKENKKDKDNKEIGFEGLESSGKKLIHLTANRAKVPNRRPPSHIFLRESEKENGVSLDPRRLSEPLLSEMKSLLQLGDIETNKANAQVANEIKAKVPPSRPLPPSIKGNKPLAQGSVLLTKTISSEECIVKAPEPIKKSVFPDVSCISGPDILQPKKIAISACDIKPQSSDKELQQLKENVRVLMETMVSRNEFNELAKQVKELKENLDKCNANCKKTVNDLKNELETEKKKRQALESELQQLKERQTT